MVMRTKKNNSNIKKSFRFLMLLLSCQCFYAGANETCVAYSDDAFIKASLNKAGADEIDEGKKEINSIIASVKKGESLDAIINFFSKTDGSQEEMRATLKNKPALLNAYSGINNWRVKNAYKWGNYLLLWSEYDHGGQSTLLLDALYCDSKTSCKMSVKFDKSSSDTDLISRFMSYVRVGAKEVPCDNQKAAFGIAEGRNEQNPFQVYVNLKSPLNLKNKDDLLSMAKSDLPAFNRACIESMSLFDINKPESPEMQDTYKRVLNGCASKLTDGSGIPVVKMTDKKTEKIFLIPAVLISDFQNTKETKIIGKYTDKGRINYIVIIKLNNGENRLYLIPTAGDGQYLMDWSYFGTGAAELIIGEYFAQYLKEKKIW